MNLDKIRIDLIENLGSYKVSSQITGRMGEQIYKLATEKGIYYVKESQTTLVKEATKNEVMILNWISDTGLSCPKVIFSKAIDDIEYMVISAIRGINAHEIKNMDIDQIVYLAVKVLKKIHNTTITTDNKKLMNRTKYDVEQMHSWLENGWINKEKFEQNNNMTIYQALKYLEEQMDILDCSVLTHGDYCLPNILIDSNLDVGVVDWAEAGINDKYKDFMTITKSIKRNLGIKYVASFFDYYGVTNVDENKLTYFEMMDQIIYCTI
jgi:Aminoglycoside phosphotransferase